MRKTTKSPGEKIVKDIKRATRKHYSSEEKIRIVLDGLRGEDSIAELCRREGISQGIYYKWSKDFMEAGKKRLAGDTARAANTDDVKECVSVPMVSYQAQIPARFVGVHLSVIGPGRWLNVYMS